MPFTLAHPAVTIPLKKFLPLSALVIGSMSPDFEYLFRLTAVSRFSHTISGIFYFCIPISLIVLWLFHSLIKQPVIVLLPDFVRRPVHASFGEFSFFPLSRLLIIIFALAVGAFSHVFWDSFTHESGWAVSQLSLLKTSVFNLGNYEVKLFKLLQHTSSVVGLALMAYFFWEWLNNKSANEEKVEQTLPDRIRYQVIITLIILTSIIALSMGFWSASGNSGLRYLEVLAVQTAIGVMVAFALCLLLYSVIYKIALVIKARI